MAVGTFKQSRFQLPLPRLSVMDRYLFVELFLPFIFGMGMFTSLALSIGTLFDLVRRVTESGLPMDIAVKILFLKMPEFVVLAFPMSMLLASLMAYSRLSSDSELIALRSIGVSIYRLVVPALLFGIVVTGIAFVFNDRIPPAASYEALATLDRAIHQDRPPRQEQNIIYPEYGMVRQPDGNEKNILKRLFYAEEFNGSEMKGLTILDRTQSGVNQVLTAERASWNISENTWDFYDGTVYLIAPDGSYRNIVRFRHQQLALPRAPLDLASQERKDGEMTIAQSRRYLEVLRLSGDDKKVRKLEVRIQKKYALPFVCFVFGLIGAAIGVRPQNTNKATSFGICVGLIFFYYLLSFLSESMGIWGALDPFTAAWLPNFLGLIAGTILLVQSSRLR